MIRCTHTTCGHSWLQILLPQHTRVDTCPVCEEEEEEREQAITADLLRQDRAKERYYNLKYGEAHGA